MNDRLGWRAAFLIQIPIIAFSCILIALKVDVKLPSHVSQSALTFRAKLVRIDWLGSLTLVLGVGSLLFSISLKTSEELPFSHPLIYGFFTFGALSSIAFLLVEKYWSEEPIMPLRLLTERTPLAVALTHFWLSLGAYSMLYNLPLYFEAVKLTSATEAGMHLLPNSVGDKNSSYCLPPSDVFSFLFWVV